MMLHLLLATMRLVIKQHTVGLGQIVREYHLVVASLLPAFNLLAEVMHELRVSDRL